MKFTIGLFLCIAICSKVVGQTTHQLTLSIDSECVINSSTILHQIHIYPNPAKNSFHIDLPSDGDLFILDQSGKISKAFKNVSGNIQVSTIDLYHGIYVIKYVSGNIVYRAKLILN